MHQTSAVTPKKSLGQHFLIDDNIARNIVRDLKLSHDDIVVEIGPGRGALTKHFVGKAKKLIAVELDSRIVEELKTQFSSPEIIILHKNFLDVDLKTVSRENGQKLRLVGNIPYFLTSDIIIKAFDEREALHDFTFMVQREVATRIAAEPGTKKYGILSVYARFYGSPEILFSVAPTCFHPRPRVVSAVIQESLFEKPQFDVDEKLFRSVVRTTFGKRRKTLRNSLKYLPWEELASGAVSTSILDKRPEQLSVEQFVELTNMLTKQLPNTLTHA